MEAGIGLFHDVRMAQRPRTWRKSFLREYREAADLSLESVAEQMGLTHSQLSKIERGIHPYNQQVLEVAALEYGCTVADLLNNSPPKKAVGGKR